MDLLPKMESEERIDSQITHRKGKEKPVIEDVNAELREETEANNEENDDISTILEAEKLEDPPKLRPQEDFTTWGTIKYRFYWFRYYHYYYADKLDKFLAAGFLWIMRMYFKFLGFAEAEPEAE